MFADTDDRVRSSVSGGTVLPVPRSSDTSVSTPVIPTAPEGEEAFLCFRKLRSVATWYLPRPVDMPAYHVIGTPRSHPQSKPPSTESMYDGLNQETGKQFLDSSRKESQDPAEVVSAECSSLEPIAPPEFVSQLPAVIPVAVSCSPHAGGSQPRVFNASSTAHSGTHFRRGRSPPSAPTRVFAPRPRNFPNLRSLQHIEFAPGSCAAVACHKSIVWVDPLSGQPCSGPVCSITGFCAAPPPPLLNATRPTHVHTVASWRAILTGWNQLHRQHDAGEMLDHWVEVGRRQAVAGRWEARIEQQSLIEIRHGVVTHTAVTLDIPHADELTTLQQLVLLWHMQQLGIQAFTDPPKILILRMSHVL